ncbi:MAG: hypothetical protein JXQ71_03360 [Verrucomicrobia bacterium]|nr:hypothetical protein [Verrucomicrobiota bacterium]
MVPRRKLTRRERRDLDIEIGFLESLVLRDPRYVEALQVLGADYSKRGDFANGLRVGQQLARLRPADPIVLYNLACSYSLTGRLRLAADALNRAIEHGYKNFRLLHKDPDLANLRRHAVFKRVQARIGQSIGS